MCQSVAAQLGLSLNAEQIAAIDAMCNDAAMDPDTVAHVVHDLIINSAAAAAVPQQRLALSLNGNAAHNAHIDDDDDDDDDNDDNNDQ